MLQIYFQFFNVESICGFTSTFVVICSARSYTFRFQFRSKRPTLDILKLFVTKLRNKYKKVAFGSVDEDGAFEIYSKFILACHKMNIIVQTTGGDESSINVNIKTPNKSLENNTRSLLMKSIHNKELWHLYYHYAIWLSRGTKNILRDDVPYFLWHGSRPHYKHFIIWGFGIYIINGRVNRKKLDMVVVWEKGLIILMHHFWSVGFDKTHQKFLLWRVELDHAFSQQC